MALVLFNIGWMRHYRGLTSSDEIDNGGRHVTENKTGGEIKNFLPRGDWYYGYVQPPGPRERVNLERLGAVPGVEDLDGVTVIFTATRPKGGRRVVGWYRDARVWRNQQQLRQENHSFYARARKENCTLLEVDKRVFCVPSAGRPPGTWGLGRTILYVDPDDESRDLVCKLREYIQDPNSYWRRHSPRSSERTRAGVPRQSDPFLRAKVEKAAIRCVKNYYSAYECFSVERENRGWDLQFTCDDVRLLVEVKGCSGDAGQVELTPNEYKAMRHRRNRNVYRLAIVTRALDDPQLSIVSFNNSDETWRDQNDREVRVEKREGARITI